VGILLPLELQMHGLLGVELPLEKGGDLRQVSQVKFIFLPNHINNYMLKYKRIDDR